MENVSKQDLVVGYDTTVSHGAELENGMTKPAKENVAKIMDDWDMKDTNNVFSNPKTDKKGQESTNISVNQEPLKFASLIRSEIPKPTRFSLLGKGNKFFSSIIPGKNTSCKAKKPKPARKSAPSLSAKELSDAPTSDFDFVVPNEVIQPKSKRGRSEGTINKKKKVPVTTPSSYGDVVDLENLITKKPRSRSVGKNKRKRSVSLFSDSEQESENEDVVNTRATRSISSLAKRSRSTSRSTYISSVVVPGNDSGCSRSELEQTEKILCGILTALEGMAEMNVRDKKTTDIWKAIEKVAKKAKS